MSTKQQILPFSVFDHPSKIDSASLFPNNNLQLFWNLRTPDSKLYHFQRLITSQSLWYQTKKGRQNLENVIYNFNLGELLSWKLTTVLQMIIFNYIFWNIHKNTKQYIVPYATGDQTCRSSLKKGEKKDKLLYVTLNLDKSYPVS